LEKLIINAQREMIYVKLNCKANIFCYSWSGGISLCQYSDISVNTCQNILGRYQQHHVPEVRCLFSNLQNVQFV